MTFIEKDLVTYRKHSFESGNRVCEDTGCGQFAEFCKSCDNLLGGYHFRTLFTVVGPRENNWISKVNERCRKDRTQVFEFM